jgi:NADH-quinone oxidoreductase subunit N
MAELIQSLRFFVPEALLIVGLLLVLAVDIALPTGTRQRRLIAAGITLLTIAAAAFVAVGGYVPIGSPVPIFQGMTVADGYGGYFKMLFLLAAAVMTVAAYASQEIEPPRATEFFAILLGMTLGMCLLASANSLLMIYLALEFVSITSYILTGFKRGDQRAAEAALKYVIYGATASGVMLFGFSYLYGLTGSLEIHEIGRGMAERLAGTAPAAEKLSLSLAAIMAFAGFAYKIAAVPFHMWCPDVYEGAPTPVTALLSVGPKAAGFAALMRFCIAVFGTSGEPWPALLGIVAAGTMTLGNLAAIGQDNVKRLLAYSSIAHAGYMLMAVAAFSADGVAAVMFYLGIYVLMNLGAFLVVMAVRDSSAGREDIGAYHGLSQRHPLLAILMTVFLLSLVGLPPLGGFIGKFYVFAALLRKAGVWYYLLALVGVLNSAISLYYYARIIKAMFLTPPDAAAATPLRPARAHLLLAMVLAVPVLGLGIYWAPLRALVERSTLLMQ